MNLFPTKSELEQQNQEQKAVTVSKPAPVRKALKYKTDKVKMTAKNRFVINDPKPNKDSIFEHKENMYRKFVETQQRLNGMEINPIGN